jgi:acyl carrier protein
VCHEYHALEIFLYGHAPGPIPCSDAGRPQKLGDWVMSSTVSQQAAVTNEDVAMKVRKLIVENLHVKARYVSDQAHLSKDLRADWLDRLELVIAIEDYFGIELTDDVVEKVVVVGDLIHLVEAHRPH